MIDLNSIIDEALEIGKLKNIVRLTNARVIAIPLLRGILEALPDMIKNFNKGIGRYSTEKFKKDLKPVGEAIGDFAKDMALTGLLMPSAWIGSKLFEPSLKSVVNAFKYWEENADTKQIDKDRKVIAKVGADILLFGMSMSVATPFLLVSVLGGMEFRATAWAVANGFKYWHEETKETNIKRDCADLIAVGGTMVLFSASLAVATIPLAVGILGASAFWLDMKLLGISMNYLNDNKRNIA